MSSMLMKMATFQEWSKKQGQYYKSYEQAKKKFLKSIDSFSQREANNLAKVLNEITNHQSFSTEKISQQILNKLPQVIDKSGEQAFADLDIDNSFKVSTKASGSAWQAYYEKVNFYKKIENLSIKEINEKEDVRPLLMEALKLQGQLNKTQGDVFEVFLQELIPYLGQKLENFSEDQVSSILENLSKNLSSKSRITTQGSQHESIDFIFEEERIKISSQGKIDVNVPAPFLDGDFPLKISAKNYGSLRDVHLLGGASAVGLISQWPVSQDAKRYFLNGLTTWEKSTPEQLLQYGRILIAIQSLAGSSGKSNEMANVLILNVRNNPKNPIRVISIRDLLDQMDLSNVDNIFTIKFDPQLQLFKDGEERTKDQFKERLTALKVNTTLNKKYLYLSKLSKIRFDRLKKICYNINKKS